MSEFAFCSCGSTFWMIADGYIECEKCGKKYHIITVPKVSIFNKSKEYYNSNMWGTD
jgi:hypothetical protein